jgi:hypothetical protein
MTFRNTLLTFCTVSVALTGCHRTLDIARPIPGTLAPPPIEDSTLSTVANTSMGSVCSQLNGLIPHPIAENPGHPCFQYGVYQHTNLACSGNANTLDASFQVAYKAGQRCGVDGVGQASCGYDHEMYATVGAGATLSWDPSWHADVTIAPRISLDTACRVTVLDVNINGFVHNKIQPTLDNITRQAPGKRGLGSNGTVNRLKGGSAQCRSASAYAATERPRRLLLRSSRQFGNFGWPGSR